jgi:hypothetical protein
MPFRKWIAGAFTSAPYRQKWEGAWSRAAPDSTHRVIRNRTRSE